MNYIKDALRQKRPLLRAAIAPTIMATALFFLTYFCFGSENTMIGPFATLSFLRFRTMRNHFSCMAKTFGIYLAMALLAFFACMQLPLCIFVNALALFWIAFILIDEYHPNNYFPAGMALIFFQIAPAADLTSLLTRIEALAASFALMLAFLFVLTKLEKQQPSLEEQIREGFSVCEQLLLSCSAALTEKQTGDMQDWRKEKSVKLHRRLFELNQNASDTIYAYNRASLRFKDKTNWYCQFVLFFQVMGYLTRSAQELSHQDDAKKLYDIIYHRFCTITPAADYHKLNFRLRRPDMRSFRLRFALRQVITLTPCLAFAKVSDLPNAYWLVISVFFMMIPFTDHTKQRIKQRVLGTMGGIVLCLVLFSVFNSFAARVGIMTMANFLIYSTPGYGASVAYITCSALAMQTLNANVTLVLAYRLGYTLIGAAIALFANSLIFPIRTKKQMDYLVEMIRAIRKDLTETDQVVEKNDGYAQWKIDQQMIKTYLLTKRLEGLFSTLPKQQRSFDFDSFEKKHMDIMSAYLSRQFLKNT